MKIRITPKIIETLREHRIFLRPYFEYGDAEGKLQDVNNEVLAEQYARIPEMALNWDSPAKIGAFSYVVPGSYLAGCEIGRFCSIGSNVRVMGENHPIDRVTTSTWTYGKNIDDIVKSDFGTAIKQNRNLPASPRTVIGHDVWIGDNATLKRGIKLGTGCIVGTQAVVTKDVPAYCIAAGNPARIVRKRFDDLVIDALLGSEWWNLSPGWLAVQDMASIEEFLKAIEKLSDKYEYASYKLLSIRDVFINHA